MHCHRVSIWRTAVPKRWQRWSGNWIRCRNSDAMHSHCCSMTLNRKWAKPIRRRSKRLHRHKSLSPMKCSTIWIARDFYSVPRNIAAHERNRPSQIRNIWIRLAVNWFRCACDRWKRVDDESICNTFFYAICRKLIFCGRDQKWFRSCWPWSRFKRWLRWCDDRQSYGIICMQTITIRNVYFSVHTLAVRPNWYRYCVAF